ncbi:MAG: hypothetical protein GY780_10660 [bacterium]|nr:hypothetical protein [bacterium]
MPTNDIKCEGFCHNCQEIHFLESSLARIEADKLMLLLDKHQRLDFDQPIEEADPLFGTDFLYGPAMGKMFGILICENLQGNRVVLKAFSGQYDRQWELSSWVGPLFDVDEFWNLTLPVEKSITDLGREIQQAEGNTEQQGKLRNRRKLLSQNLMKDIHKLYCLNNFNGQSCRLKDLQPEQGLPTGTADCCAPKLLNHAALNQLKPLSLAEFFWGQSNRSLTRHQGEYYPACTDKCGPVLGYMLCGVQKF